VLKSIIVISKKIGWMFNPEMLRRRSNTYWQFGDAISFRRVAATHLIGTANLDKGVARWAIFAKDKAPLPEISSGSYAI
jgi:hypothetical protein